MDVEQLKSDAIANAEAIVELKKCRCELELQNALGFIQTMQHSISATRKNAIYECILIARDIRSYAPQESANSIDLIITALNSLLTKYDQTN
jgi:hypothetical protein